MKKPLFIYFILVLIILAILCLLPINLFDGEVHYKYEIYDYKVKEKLSLSYFFGIGASPSETKGVVDFYLLPVGYLLAFLIIFFLPAIITYRLKLRKKEKIKD
jgi:Zn-dependent protease